MFKLFKKDADNKVVVAEPVLKAKTVNEIIEEIHESFYTEVDKLLSSAKISNSLDTDKQELINKCERLKSLGFTNTKEVKEAEVEIKRLNDLKTENESKKSLIEAINYFSFKYPMYKFITEDSVKNICEKYNLVYGEINRYTGTVPDLNLKQIESFKISEEDECYFIETRYAWGSFTEKRVITLEQCKKSKSENSRLVSSSQIFGKCSLEIAAPLSDFNMTEAEVKDFKLSDIIVYDPVVLKPVIFDNKKHFLIVSAWGQEASDELVVNQKMN